MPTKCLTVIAWVAILLGPVVAALPAQADIYKWVDDKGVAHYSDKPPQAAEGNPQIERQPDAPPSAYQPPKKVKSSAETENVAKPGKKGSAKKVNRPPEVELYVTSWCKYCKMAQAFLRKNNIPLKVYDIEKDAEAAKRRRAIDPRNGVPLAVINGRVLLGFSEAAYRSALGLIP